MLINENTVPHINNRSTKSTHLNIITTADGSDSIKNCDLNVSYHSEHGAIQESKHIFIQSGLHDYLNRYQHHTVSILEIGFGTGLNALLSLLYSAEHHLSITIPLNLILSVSTLLHESTIQNSYRRRLHYLNSYTTALGKQITI